MFYSIEGHVLKVFSEKIVIQSGQHGFECATPYNSNFKQQENINLYVFLVWNQDQGPSLVGFKTEQERKVFILLISCSGIGPKMALSILSSLGMHGIISALKDQNAQALAKAKGLGISKAEKLVLALKNKINELPSDMIYDSSISDGIQALKAFGYSDQSITSFINRLQKELHQNISTQEVIKKGLEYMQEA